jgi:hypothetical protein
MGTSIIQIRVVGNHGCQREVKDGGTTAALCDNCTSAGGCIDALAKEFAAKLKAVANVQDAFLLHWPEVHDGKKIVDDLITGKRNGSF